MSVTWRLAEYIEDLRKRRGYQYVNPYEIAGLSQMEHYAGWASKKRYLQPPSEKTTQERPLTVKSFRKKYQL